MPKLRVCAAFTLLSATQLLTLSAQQHTCKAIPAKTISPDPQLCSFTGLNGDCTVYVDRMRPIAPPTIYARRGSKITLRVVNPSPFETVALDYKSGSDTLAPDMYSGLMNAVSGTAGKLQLNFMMEEIARPKLTNDEEMVKLLQETASSQRLLISENDPTTVFRKIAMALNPPPHDACELISELDDDGYPSPWLAPGAWSKAVQDVLSALEDPSKLTSDKLDALASPLDTAVQQLQSGHLDTTDPDRQARWKTAVAAVGDRQKALKVAIANRKKWENAQAQLAAADQAPHFVIPDRTHLNALKYAISGMHLESFEGNDLVETATDPSSRDLNYTTASWSLDYANKLTTPITDAIGGTSGAAATAPTAADILNGAVPSTSLALLSVSFQTQPRLEFATGLMVPVRPFHSYSTVAVASGGTVTGNTIQEMKTYTVVPVALVNIEAWQRLVRQNSVAAFGSIAVGYNPTTSAVEFGVGGIFSWRYMQFGVLADINRDTQLSGGFTVNQPLPVSNAPNPLTTTGWGVKPAISISVRLPLGGGGSSNAAGAAAGGASAGGSTGGASNAATAGAQGHHH